MAGPRCCAASDDQQVVPTTKSERQIMGWGRMMLLGNVGQQLDIQDLENAINQMQADVAQAQNLERTEEQSIDELRSENHELKLYLATLVKLLVAKGVIRQEEVDTAVQAIEKN
jgi:hypothetical protein